MNQCIVTTTCKTKESAKQLASLIIENDLAAAVQIESIESLYKWKGKVECEVEYRLTIKSNVNVYKRLENLIKENHEYELPQIVMTLIDKGSDEYLNWIDENIKKGK